VARFRFLLGSVAAIHPPSSMGGGVSSSPRYDVVEDIARAAVEVDTAAPSEGSMAALESAAIWDAMAASDSEQSGDASLVDGRQVEPALRLFLAESLRGVPLPRPWAAREDELGCVCFMDLATGIMSRIHPLAGTLLELARLFRACLRLSADCRAQAASAARTRWELAHDAEHKAWFKVPHESGQFYFCNSTTGQTTWEDPLAMALPPQFMRLRAAKWLTDEAYFAYLNGRCAQSDCTRGCGHICIPCEESDSDSVQPLHRSAQLSPARGRPRSGLAKTLLGRSRKAAVPQEPLVDKRRHAWQETAADMVV